MMAYKGLSEMAKILPRTWTLMFTTSLSIMIGIQSHTAKAQDVKQFLAPQRHMCLALLELEKVEIDPQHGTIRFETQLAADYNAAVSWLQGYFTAWNLFKPEAWGDLTKKTTPQQWMTWIFSYCRAHPSDNLLNAANQLANALMGK
jgi:hypothetical protein